jgi:ubiquinone biosynthesis protein COQ9
MSVAKKAPSVAEKATTEERLILLLQEADEMWAFSRANETRGHFDCQWNEKRIALLRELGASPALHEESTSR